MDLFGLQAGVMEFAFVALLVVKIWAFVDALLRPREAFVAAEKLTKPAWVLITGLSVAAAWLSYPSALGLFSIIGIVASFVYLLDARPALVSVTRRR